MNVAIMESKGGKKESSHYEAPLDYIIEDVRPYGGIQKFRSAAYSNVCVFIQVCLLRVYMKFGFF